ncbi:MAG: hypothetical protein KVP17_004202 [Porospora cf. gigantea B]|uniref:uncharacterized protein n=1 Tax=Porospora cf. gigantea B TaxID=2853592 RepID=UPI003571F870|nr:MAG: hypothetical protein KVP17_004202 [Porospora cf. gigantea B]
MKDSSSKRRKTEAVSEFSEFSLGLVQRSSFKGGVELPTMEVADFSVSECDSDSTNDVTQINQSVIIVSSQSGDAGVDTEIEVTDPTESAEECDPVAPVPTSGAQSHEASSAEECDPVAPVPTPAAQSHNGSASESEDSGAEMLDHDKVGDVPASVRAMRLLLSWGLSCGVPQWLSLEERRALTDLQEFIDTAESPLQNLVARLLWRKGPWVDWTTVRWSETSALKTPEVQELMVMNMATVWRPELSADESPSRAVFMQDLEDCPEFPHPLEVLNCLRSATVRSIFREFRRGVSKNDMCPTGWTTNLLVWHLRECVINGRWTEPKTTTGTSGSRTLQHFFGPVQKTNHGGTQHVLARLLKIVEGCLQGNMVALPLSLLQAFRRLNSLMHSLAQFQNECYGFRMVPLSIRTHALMRTVCTALTTSWDVECRMSGSGRQFLVELGRLRFPQYTSRGAVCLFRNLQDIRAFERASAVNLLSMDSAKRKDLCRVAAYGLLACGPLLCYVKRFCHGLSVPSYHQSEGAKSYEMTNTQPKRWRKALFRLYRLCVVFSLALPLVPRRKGLCHMLIRDEREVTQVTSYRELLRALERSTNTSEPIGRLSWPDLLESFDQRRMEHPVLHRLTAVYTCSMIVWRAVAALEKLKEPGLASDMLV